MAGPLVRARVLLIDDDPSLREVLSLALGDAGYEVILAEDGSAGLASARADRPAIVVSDVNLPRMDGFTLCRRLREAGDRVPVVLLTSRDSEIDEALGLELGADDYVTKPFSTRVLLARIAALLRREASRAAPTRAPARTLGELEIDVERLELRFRGALVVVTVTEFRMVETLAGRPGVVYSRATLLERMRGDDSVVDDRLVDTYVRRLRRKFEAVAPDFAAIETLVGAGYRWRDGAS
ncbi:MAG: response regulator transcription factor [Pseudomonadota bacterium]|nr:response regulator transcription factor [Pseudomonadota bacterium]